MRYPLRWFGRSLPLELAPRRGADAGIFFYESAQGSPAPEAAHLAAPGHGSSVAKSEVKDRWAALAASEARFQSLTLLGSDWHWDQDVQHRFTAISGNLSDPIGTTIAKNLGRPLWQMPQVATFGPQSHWKLLAMLRMYEYGVQSPLTGR